MKDAKTIGGIKDFTTQESTYGKWVLNRSAQAEYVSELLQQAGLKNVSDNPRKCLRMKEIEKSEKAVQNIKSVLSDDFINPFSSELDTDKLYNLASGRPVTEDIRECLLSYKKRGKRGTSKDISIQRDILGLIVAASNKEKGAVDIEKALTYPLAPVSLPLASADGAWRKTAKRKLLEKPPFLEDREINIETLPTSKSLYIGPCCIDSHNSKSSEYL